MTPVKKPHFSKNTKNNCWKLDRIYIRNVDGLTVKGWKGFESDGGSMPKALWFLAHPFDSMMIDGFIVHDLLCHTHQVDRKTADFAMRTVHEQDGVARWKREAAYRVISMLPDSYYWNNDEQDLKFLQYNHDLILSQGLDPLDFGLDLQKA